MGSSEELSSADDAEEQELKEALELMERLHRENTELQGNFEQLKRHYIDLVTAHKALQQQHVALRDEREQVEKQYQQLCEGWRIELESKQAAFDEARSQLLTPRDVDLLKIKLLDEVEQPFRAKCESLAKEAETAQENFVKLRREYEAYKLQAEAKIARLQNERANVTAEHNGRVARLNSELQAAKQTAAGLHEGRNAARQAVRERDEHIARIRHLQSEVDDVRGECERAVRDKLAALQRADERSTRLQALQLEAQSLLEGAQGRARALEAELRDACAANDSLTARALQLQQQVKELMGALSSAKAQHEAELLSWEQRADAAAAEHSHALDKLQQAADDADHKLRSQLSTVKAELEHLRSEMASKIALSEEPLRSTIAALEADLRGERSALLAEKQARKHDEAASKQQMHALEATMQELRREAAEVRSEASRLHEEHASLLTAHGDLKAQLQGKIASMSHVEVSTKTLTERCDALEDANKKLTAERDRLFTEVEHAVKATEAAKSRLEQESREHSAWSENVQKTWLAEKALLSKNAADAAQAMRSQLDSALRRSKQQASVLTKELMRAKEESSLLEMQLSEAQAELATFKQYAAQSSAGRDVGGDPNLIEQALSGSLQHLRAQLADLRSRQDVYLKAAAPSISAR